MIVFLDIDGPIQSMRSGLASLKYDPVAVAVVNNLLQVPGVRLVLASTVRSACKDPVHAAELLERKYGLRGMTFHHVWRTGYTQNCDEGQSNGRTKEIQAWMDEYGYEEGEVYFAIDDEPVEVNGIHHIKANYDGLPVEAIVFIQHLSGIYNDETLDAWTSFPAKMKLKEARVLVAANPIEETEGTYS
jgi:hypothetical protein